jgi:hypothetical protein
VVAERQEAVLLAAAAWRAAPPEHLDRLEPTPEMT